MLKLNLPNATKKIECPFDDTEPKTIFEISVSISISERNKIRDMMSEAKNLSGSDSYKIWREIVKVGLKGIENAQDFTMNGQVSETYLDLLSEVRLLGSGYDNLVNWLGTQIWAENTMSEDEKKKLILLRESVQATIPTS